MQESLQEKFQYNTLLEMFLSFIVGSRDCLDFSD